MTYVPNGTPTQEQNEVIFFPFQDPLLVVGSAGCGKTYCLTERLGHGVYDGILKPEKTLVVSFTNKAVNEIIGRLRDNVGDIVEAVIGKTIHSFCRWLVVTNYKERLSGRYTGPTWENVLTLPLQKIVLQAICEEEKAMFGPQYAARWIQDAKRERIDPATAYGWYKSELMHEGLEGWMATKLARELESVSRWYEDVKKDPYCLRSNYVIDRMKNARNGGIVWMRGGWMDFNDMILKAEALLKDDAEARAYFQNAIDYAIVDEGQDTGPEIFVLETVACPKDGVPPRITVVGDGKQAVMRFRGAIPDKILYGWKDRHGKTSVVKFITVNWRSENTRIVEAANHLARDARPDYNAPMATRPDAKPGVLLTYTFFGDTNDEARHVVEAIAEYLDDERAKPRDFAIIYRTNAQSRAFEDVLLRLGIPYVVVSAYGFFDRKVVKDCIAFLRLMRDPNDVESLFRIRNMPSAARMAVADKTTRFMGPAYFSKLKSEAQRLERGPVERVKSLMPWREKEYSYLYLALKAMAEHMPDWKAANTVDMIEQLEMLFEMADGEIGPAQALLRIYEHTYTPFVRRREGIYESAGGDADPVFETLDELVDIAARYPTVDKFLNYIEASQKSLKKQDEAKSDDGRVTLLTGHKAKGLEWPFVFVVGVSDGLVPHALSKPGAKVLSKKGDLPVRNKPDLIAEHNWLYVAVTRGKEEVHVSGPSVYRGQVCPPTDWMLELVAAGFFERMAAAKPDFADVFEAMTSGEPDRTETTEYYTIIQVGDDLLILDVDTSEPLAAYWQNMFVARAVGQRLNMTEIVESKLYRSVRGLTEG